MRILMLIAAVVLTEGSIVNVFVPGQGSISETDIRAGGREVHLTLKGDTWIPTFAMFASGIVNLITSSSGVTAEPDGFMAKKRTILPTTSVVVDQRKNDFSVVALILQPDVSYNIQKDELVYISIPGNTTLSGAIPLPPEGTGPTSFVIMAAQSILEVPPVITEEQVRAGDLRIVILLTNGETFVQRKPSAIHDMISQVSSSLENVPGEVSSFNIRKNLIFNSEIGFELISPYDRLHIRLEKDTFYNFFAEKEIINISLPTSFMTSGFVPTPQSPLGFVILNSPGTVRLDTTTTITELMVRSGTVEFTLVLKHDKWNLVDNTSLPVITRKLELIQRFRSVKKGSWDARLAEGQLLSPQSFILLDPVPTNRQEQRLLVKLLKDPSYRLESGLSSDEIQFSIPPGTLISGLPPYSSTVENIFRFSIKAMGDITQLSGSEPEHSGDFIGLPGAKLSMIIRISLNKDKWKAADCRDVIRSGFSSNLPTATHGFMAKLDRIVNPASINIVGNDMEIMLSRESTYTIAPAVGTAPAPEIISLRIPAQCVALRVPPGGVATIKIDLHPSEIPYSLYTPRETDRPEMFEIVYANRPFNMEVHYANPDTWKQLKLINSIQCDTGVRNYDVDVSDFGNCSVLSCRTRATAFPNAHVIRLLPPKNVADWTPVGTWSVCVFFWYSGRWTRIGQPIDIQADPLDQQAPGDGDLTASVDPSVLAVCE